MTVVSSNFHNAVALLVSEKILLCKTFEGLKICIRSLQKNYKLCIFIHYETKITHMKTLGTLLNKLKFLKIHTDDDDVYDYKHGRHEGGAE